MKARHYAALFLGLLFGAVVFGCTQADKAAVEKAVADSQAKVNQYCDARQKALEALQAPAEAGAAQ